MDTVFKYLTDLLGFSKDYYWIFQSFFIVLLTLVVHYFMKRLLDHLEAVAEKSKTELDDILVRTARKPVRMFVWIIGILMAAEVVKSVSQEPIFDLIGPIREIAIIAMLSWFLVRLVKEGERSVQKPGVLQNPMDATTASALGKLVRLAIVITATLAVLQNLGVSISAILAFGGMGGIAVGFAAKDLLSNFFGGLMIYLDQPFKVGDWVRSPDQDIEGTVEQIGWRLTCIRTFDKRPLYVPNATFTTISVENPSRMLNRRIKETIGVRYEDAGKIGQIVEDVKAMLQEHPEIDTNQTLMVNVNEFAASSVNFFIYTFTKTVDWAYYHKVKQDVMLNIVDIIERNGAEFAFPTQTLHVHNEPEVQ